MRWSTWWKEFIALTPTERKAALLIGAAFVAGLGIRWYQRATDVPVVYDYSASDSTFLALSARVGEGVATPSDSARGHLVNLNTATKEELLALPGIGESTAERILLRREDVGPFVKPEDLMTVKGVGKKKFEQLKHLITVH